MSGRHVRRGLRHALGLGFGGALLVAVVALAIAVVVLPRLTASVPLTVLTSSMEPTYPPGTLVVVRPTPVDEIRLGDVITYQLTSGRPEVVTHRVIGVTRSTDSEVRFQTQGDNNPQPDVALVVADQVKGTVWYAVPLVGWVASALDGGTKSWLTMALASGLFGYTLFTVVSWARDRRRRRLP